MERDAQRITLGVANVLTALGQRSQVTNDDVGVGIERDAPALYTRAQHLIDTHTRRADQVSQVALGQAQGDDCLSIGGRLAVLAGKRQQLTRNPPIDIQCRKGLNVRIGQTQTLGEILR